MAKVAVILSGCGHLDGAEIREAVMSLYFLDKEGAEATVFAPDIPQHHVIDHFSGEEEGEPRNVLDEAARIARGTILPLSELQAEDFDALVIPGGFGVAKNLSSLAFKGADAQVLPEFAAAVKAFYAAKKPIGAICIAPAVLSLILRDQGIELTIGEDEGTAGVIEATGNTHVVAQSWQAVVDKEHKIATASAYMREDRLAPIGLGIEKVIQAVLFLI